MQLYTEELKGWVFCDTYGYRWLIQLTNLPLSGINLQTSNSSTSIEYKIQRFGVFTSDSAAAFPATTGTYIIPDLGCSSFTVPVGGRGVTPGVTSTWVTTSNMRLELVSIKSNGQSAILAVMYPMFELENSSDNWFRHDCHDLSISYVLINLTSGAEEGLPPVISSTVARTLQQTVGYSGCDGTASTSLVRYGVGCDCYGGGHTYYVYVSNGGENITTYTRDMIWALYYNADDELEEMKVDMEVEYTTGCSYPTPPVNGSSGGGASVATCSFTVKTPNHSYTLYFKEENSVSATIGCQCPKTPGESGAVRTGSASWKYTVYDSNGLNVVYSDWTYDIDDLVAYYPDAGLIGGGLCWLGYGGSTQEFDRYVVLFPTVAPIEVYGWGDVSFRMKRYSYNVIGPMMFVNTAGGGGLDDIQDRIFVAGDALSPSGIISRTTFDNYFLPSYGGGITPEGEEKYFGAYNIRTGQAKASVSTPIGYT